MRGMRPAAARLCAAVATLMLVLPVSPAAGQTPDCFGEEPTIVGTDGGETLAGTSGRDVIQALGGNDAVYGGGGNDWLRSHEGRDRLNGGPGTDVATFDQRDVPLRADLAAQKGVIGGRAFPLRKAETAALSLHGATTEVNRSSP